VTEQHKGKRRCRQQETQYHWYICIHLPSQPTPRKKRSRFTPIFRIWSEVIFIICRRCCQDGFVYPGAWTDVPLDANIRFVYHTLRLPQQKLFRAAIRRHALILLFQWRNVVCHSYVYTHVRNIRDWAKSVVL